MADTITRIVPQDGWSPIICRRVPIQQTITSIVGDNGDNAIYEGGSIKNFHAKIDWQDQYSGSRVPADILTESSDDYGETWTMNEVEEHEEGSFELDYEGHERDFEVKLNGTSLYIRYRWQMNGQEIEDADGSLEHTITVTDYPVKLEIDAHYEDNFGGYEIGAPIFNSAKIFYKSGAVDDTKTRGAFTKPLQATLWADKDGWQSQTWSYTENGYTVTAQVGARITALRDVKIEAELLGGGSGELESLIATYDDGEDIFYKVNVDSSILEDGMATIYCKEGEYEYSAWLYDESQMTPEAFGYESFSDTPSGVYLLPNGSHFLEVFESLTFYSDEDCTEQLELTFVRGNGSSPIFKEGEVVSKDDLMVTMTRNDNSTYEATDYWMPNNYALGRGKQSVTVQKGSLSTTLPVTVAYPTKVEVGNVNGGDFTKSSFYEYGEYIEPTHYKAYYECYDGTEGFDEVAEIDGEWEGKIESSASCKIYIGKESHTEGYTIRLYKVDGITDADISGDEYVLLTEEGIEYYLFTKEFISTELQDGYIGEDEVEGIEEGFYSYREIGPDGNIFDASTYDGLPYDGNLYHKNEEGEKGEPIKSPFEVASCGEYSSEVGTLTLGKKAYLYRAGLEPIDEENYLFIKDFKDIPFNYGLVNCYEPQWEEKPEDWGVLGKPSFVVPLPSIFFGEEGYEYLYYEVETPSEDLMAGDMFVATDADTIDDTKLAYIANSEAISEILDSAGLPVPEFKEGASYISFINNPNKGIVYGDGGEVTNGKLYYIGLTEEELPIKTEHPVVFLNK